MSGRAFFTVVVPTYNRPQQIRRCVESLARLAYPRECFEVIVVDDGGDQHVVLGDLRERCDLTVVRKPQGGAASARNFGSLRARGEYLAFTDDDCEPEADWLSAFERGFQERSGHMLGGATFNRFEDNLCAEASQQLIEYLYSYYDSHRGGPRFFTANNIALETAAFRQIGGFDTVFRGAGGEDRELCDRWLAHGLHMTRWHEARVAHGHSMSLSGFLRQHYNYGRGAECFHRQRAAWRGASVQLESLRFYRDLVWTPVARQHPQAGPVSALLVLSQLANGAGFFAAFGQTRVRDALRALRVWLAGLRPGGVRPSIAERFEGTAQAYAAYRPGYPEGALRAVVAGLDPAIRALDVGCGTGISTRALAPWVEELVGVEPNRGMLDVARADTPANVDWAIGSAEHLPQASGWADLVLCAQAYPWFDTAVARRELHRVLRPAGRLALVANLRMDTGGFASDFTRTMARLKRRACARPADPTREGLFRRTGLYAVPNPCRLTRTALLGWANSHADLVAAGVVRLEVEEALGRIFARHAREGVVYLDQWTEVALFERV